MPAVLRTHAFRGVAAAVLLALLSTLLVLPPASAADDVLVEAAAGAEVIPNQYIVTLAAGADSAEMAAEMASRGADVQHIYERSGNGVAAKLPPGLVRRLQSDPRVTTIEPDVYLELSSTVTQDPVPSWGLDRIDQRERPLDGQFIYSEAGDDVPIYVIDTGVRSTHRDFGGRVTEGFSAFGDDDTEDCHGHGTHVAGIAAGATHGVAKDATIVPVRVMNCSGGGSGSDVLAGIDWILDTHPRGTPGVANFSIVAGQWTTLDDRVESLDAAGIVVAAGAGNDNDDACFRSPARSSYALTAGATTSSDARWSSSNYGTCVDVFAPGHSITSTWRSGDTATRSMSGTSMASPFVAGAAAVLYGEQPNATTEQLRAAVVAESTPDVLGSIGTGSPNALLYTNPPDVSPEPEPEPDPEPEPGADYEHDPKATPSTNEQNRTNGWAHVNLIGQRDGEITLEFVQPRGFTACFEYRLPDEEPTYSADNYNTLIGDGLWNFRCVGGGYESGPVEVSLDAPEGEMQVRMVFGAEAKERFWWTAVGSVSGESVGDEVLDDDGASSRAKTRGPRSTNPSGRAASGRGRTAATTTS